MKKIYVKIKGITCDHCRSKIKNALLKENNIKDVMVNKNIAQISYDKDIDKKKIIKTILDLDYITKEDYISDNLKDLNNKINLREFIIIFVLIILIGFLINKVFGYNVFNVIPTINNNITYGMLVLTGLLTSIHCISMCGAINLVAVLDKKQNKSIKKPLLYNVGRIISYTIVGFVVGLIGSAFNINAKIEGIIIIAAAIIMFIMALSLLGVLNVKFPYFKKRKIKTNNAFIIGLLNGFMPCGPLQAMQVYALSTGSALKGALSMFLFGVGTIPLMLSFGFVLNIVKGKGKVIINKIASVLILVLSLIMLNRGLLSLNLDITKPFNENKNYASAIIKEDYQVIEFDLSYNNYEDIIVQKGVLVKMIINVDEKYLTGCNEEIVIQEFGIRQKLSVGENIIEFTPNKTGTFTYTCWMNMIKNSIKVIDDESYFEKGDNK